MDLFNDSKPRSVAKGTILQHAGDTTKLAFKVVNGCLKSYVIDKSGKEHILQFAPEGWFLSDMNSFYNQLPSEVFIEAIEDSELVTYSRNSLTQTKDWEKDVLIEINNKLRNNLIATNKRLIALLSFTAEQRYLEFAETYPTLVQRLSLKLIASYIGITPEYLSEIRRKLAGK